MAGSSKHKWMDGEMYAGSAGLYGWKLSGKERNGANSMAAGGRAAQRPGLPVGPNGSGVGGHRHDTVGSPNGLVAQGVEDQGMGVVGWADDGVAGADAGKSETCSIGANICLAFGATASSLAGATSASIVRAGARVVDVVVVDMVVVVAVAVTLNAAATVVVLAPPFRFTDSQGAELSPHCVLSLSSVDCLQGV